MSNLIEIYRGDSVDVLATITNKDGTPYLVENTTSKLTAKRKATLPDSSAIFSISGQNQESNKILFSIPYTSTDVLAATYLYDIQIINSISQQVYTPIQDSIIISNDITRTSL